MGSSIFNQAAEFLRENKTARRALGIMVCLALLVALGTVGVLTSTGQALTKKVQVLDCVFKGHEHTPGCYDGDGNVICGYADYVVHVHNDDCRNEAGELVCPLPEVYPHTHSDECWQEVTELVCGQTEDPGHTHSEACYSYEQTDELICGLEGHTHDESCYGVETVLTCEVPEHAHGDACYDPETGELVCGLEEHTHSDACYTQNQVVTCGKEEHTHDASCYKQIATLICTEAERPAGHVHTEECRHTERVLTCTKLEMHEHTEDCFDHDAAGQRLGLICGKTELLEHVHGEACFKTVEVQVSDGSGALCGFVEHTHDDSCFDPETGAAICGYPEHTHDASCFPAEETPEPVYVCGLEEHTHSEACYGEDGELTCGLEEHTHSDACLAPAGTESEAAPETFCGKAEHTHDESCFDENGEPICGLEEHTHDESCFVEPVTYYCGLEEHAHDETCYDESGALICGLEEHTHSDECLVQMFTQTAEAEGVRVTVKYGLDAGIPEGAVFKAEQLPTVNEDGTLDQHYSQRLAEATSLMESENEAGTVSVPLMLLNVGFYDENGLEIIPLAPVTVTVQMLDQTGAEVGSEITIVHFAESGAEAIDTTGVEDDYSTSFVMDSFSDIMPMLNGKYASDDGSGAVGPLENAVYSSASSHNFLFEHNKTIDYLGDGGNNKDTTVDGDTSFDENAVTDDLYRLYLDMEGKSEPVDLLLVVDLSGSMSTGRAARLESILFGDNGEGGIVGEFLAPNKEAGKAAKDKNYVAMVYYGGRYETKSTTVITADGKKETSSQRWLNPTISPLADTEGGIGFRWTSDYPPTASEDQIGWDISAKAGWNTKKYQATTTNYVAGYMQANNMLRDGTAATERAGHKQVVVFLSDGLPTQYYTKEEFEANYATLTKTSSLTRYGGGADAMVFNDFDSWGNLGVVDSLRTALIYHFSNNETKYTGGPDTTTRKSTGKALAPDPEHGDNVNRRPTTHEGYYTVITNESKCYYNKDANAMTGLFSGNIKPGDEADSPYIYENMRCFDVFARNNQGIQFFTVGIDMGDKVDDKYSRLTVLNYMAQRYGRNAISVGTSSADGNALENALRQIVFPSGVSISDQLSAYVDLYADQPDIKVTATSKKDGTVIELWSYLNESYNGESEINGKFNTEDKIGDLKADQIIKSVTYDKEKKIISVNFVDSYSLNENYTFTLSFNVKANENAYNTYARNGYNGVTGQDNTDYKGTSNTTSSGKGGLKSNDAANVHYTVEGRTYDEPYDDPVIQVWRTRFKFTKVDDSITDASGTGTKTVSGIPFQLRYKATGAADFEPYKVYGDGAPEEKDGWYLTGADGTIDFGYLPCGEYQLVEKVPAEYKDGGTEKTWLSFNVVKGRIVNAEAESGAIWKGDEVSTKSVEAFLATVNSKTNTDYFDGEATLTVVNTVHKAPVRIIKVDNSKDHVPVNGATFELYMVEKAPGGGWTDGTKMGDYTSAEVGGKQGVIFEGDLAVEHFYYLVETKAPENFKALAEKIYFFVDYKEGLKEEADPEEVASVDKDGTTLVLTIENTWETAKAKLIKIDSSTNKNLGGAEFALYGPYADVGASFVPDDSDHLLWTGLSGEDNGVVTGTGTYKDTQPGFPVLLAGNTYFLVETVTPAGYNSLPAPVRITVDHYGKVTAMLDSETTTGLYSANAPDTDGVYTITIPNTTGFVLPRSGGEGTTVYLLSGTALIALAGSLLLLKKKKESRA